VRRMELGRMSIATVQHGRPDGYTRAGSTSRSGPPSRGLFAGRSPGGALRCSQGSSVPIPRLLGGPTMLPRQHLVFVALLTLAGTLPARGEPPAEKIPLVRLDRYGDPLPEGAVARMGTVRFRHAGLRSVAFSSDGKRLVTAGVDRNIALWETA